jgi:hypothetical protein
MELLIPVHVVADGYSHNYTVVFFLEVFGPAALSVGGRGPKSSLPTRGPVSANLNPHFKASGEVCASGPIFPVGHPKSGSVEGVAHTNGVHRFRLCRRRAPLPHSRKGSFHKNSSQVISRTVASDRSQRRSVSVLQRRSPSRGFRTWMWIRGLAGLLRREIISLNLIGRLLSCPLPDSPVVVVSGQTEADDTRKVLGICACGYSIKNEIRGTHPRVSGGLLGRRRP